MQLKGVAKPNTDVYPMAQIGEVVTTIPTIGFNVESVTYKNLNFNVWVNFLRPYSVLWQDDC